MAINKKKRRFDYRNEQGESDNFVYGDRVQIYYGDTNIGETKYENIDELNDHRIAFSTPHIKSDFFITDSGDIMNAWSFEVGDTIRRSLTEINPVTAKRTPISDVESHADGRNYDYLTDSWFDTSVKEEEDVSVEVFESTPSSKIIDNNKLEDDSPEI